jgi:hypothetical protein
MDTKSSRETSLLGKDRGRGPLTLFLDLFSSVRLGIVLLVVLFVYSTIGSAGIVYPAPGPADFTVLGVPFRHEMMRQWRGLELTEFEWFHTWFFDINIGLICLNIIITTLRRIRLNAINLGVWLIHAGIIILSIGSFIYFGLKVEGDAPVIRRQVMIGVPGAPPGRIAAVQGSSTAVTTPDGEYRFTVMQIDPEWELRTEGDEGKKAFAVTVGVEAPTGSFMRQLLDGYPQYTEDVIQGEGRVKKIERFGGKALADESIQMALEPMPQPYFWIKDSAALAVREAGGDRWSQRPIHGLPRYNDYVTSVADDVWPFQSDRYGRALRPHPLDIRVHAPNHADDALSDAEVRVTGFLRYAVMQDGFEPGNPRLNPVIELTVSGIDGRPRNVRLLARDSSRSASADGRVTFDWVEREEQIAALTESAPHALTLQVAGTDVELVVAFTGKDAGVDKPMRPVGDTGWQYRIREIVERLPLSSGETVTLVLVDLVTPEGGSVTRWVFEDPSRTRDNPQTAENEPARVVPPDARLVTSLSLGGLLADLQIVAGPGEIGVRMFFDDDSAGGERKEVRPKPLDAVKISGGRTVIFRRLIPDAIAVRKPLIIPWQQRDKDAESVQAFALVRVEVTSGIGDKQRRESRWIPFHRYSFDDPNDTPPSLTHYEPAVFTLADGRPVEVIVARERRRLPTPVVLDDFILTSHVGGFTGESLSIRDWTSVLRFQSKDGGWTDRMSVSTNAPAAYSRFWYFQAFWDAPRPPTDATPQLASQGMTFTGLGVGNREGVQIQLAGCCISVLGMFYAFYIKPIIKRRRRQQVLADLAAGRYAGHGPGLDDSTAKLVGAHAPASAGTPLFEEHQP